MDIQNNLSQDIINAQTDLQEINTTLSIISQEDIDVFQNDTTKIAEMYAIDARLNASALQTFNDLPGINNGSTVVLTGSNSIVIIAVPNQRVRIECTLDLDSIRTTLIALEGELVGIDTQIPVLDAEIVKNLAGAVGGAGNVTLRGQCGIQLNRLNESMYEINGCSVVNYSASVEQDIAQTQQDAQSVINYNNNLTTSLTQLLETIVIAEQAVSNVSSGNVIKRINGLNTTTVNVYGINGVSVTNLPSSHRIEFNVSGLKSINTNLTGPTVTLAAGTHITVTNPSPNVIRVASGAQSYSACYQNAGNSPLLSTTVITALNTWTPWYISGYIGCPFIGSNAPFTNTNCQVVTANPCQAGWALFGITPVSQVMFVVPPEGRVYRISLSISMTITQQNPTGPGCSNTTFSTPQYALSTDNSCATGIDPVFSVSMAAYDRDCTPVFGPFGQSRSYTYYGEITLNTAMPEWAPGTMYFLCFLNIGAGFPVSNGLTVYPALTKVI